MGDAVKIGVKAALIVGITAAIIALFSNIQIPTIDYTNFRSALGTGLAVVYHYVPISQVLFPIVLIILAFDVALRSFHLAMIAIRWVMKVNE